MSVFYDFLKYQYINIYMDVYLYINNIYSTYICVCLFLYFVPSNRVILTQNSKENASFSTSVIYTYAYTYIYTYICMCISIYTYILFSTVTITQFKQQQNMNKKLTRRK